MIHQRQLLFLGALAIFLGSQPSKAQEQSTQFRGDRANPVAEQTLPTTWSTTENVEWSTKIPGRGWSSPIVTGGKIFVTSVVTDGASKKPQVGIDYSNELVAKLAAEGLSEEEIKAKVMERDFELPNQVNLHYFLHCLDLETGQEHWKQEYHTGKPPGGRHRKNSFASETPVTDGEHIFVYAAHVGLWAYTLDGAQKWKVEMENHPVFFEFGSGTSPVLVGDKLIIIDDNEKASFIAALDKSNGQQIWKQARLPESKPGLPRSAWSTPYVWKTKLRTEIVTVGSGLATSYDIDGNELWRLKGISPGPAASSFAFEGNLLLNGGRGAAYYSIRPGASGDISLQSGERENKSIVWTQQRAGTYIPTPVAWGGALYILQDKGIISRHTTSDGKSTWKKRIKSSGADFTTSPWASDGKIFCLSEQGDTYVLTAGEQFELLAVNSLGEFCLATPAIIGDRLILRTETRLYSIRDSNKGN